MVGTMLLERGVARGAGWYGNRTTIAEPTAVRQGEQARDHTGNRIEPVALWGAESGNGLEEATSVRVEGLIEHVARATTLNDPPSIHDGNFGRCVRPLRRGHV